MAVSRPLYDLHLLLGWCCVLCVQQQRQVCVLVVHCCGADLLLYGVSTGNAMFFVCGQVLKLHLRGRIYAGCTAVARMLQ